MVTLLALEIAKHDSWRGAFPQVPHLDAVYKCLERSRLELYHFVQLDIIRLHAVELNRADVDQALHAIIAKQQSRNRSIMLRLRRWYYDKKCRIALRYQQ
jgi:hypothetical protein